MLLRNLRQMVSVLTFVAGQQRQIELLIEIAHMGLGDAHLRGELQVNFAVRGAVLLAPPANPHQYLIAIGGARRSQALSLRGVQAHSKASTGRTRTATGPAGYRQGASERLHGLIPRQIVTHDQ